MLTYRYDHKTKEYLRSEDGFLDPLETEKSGHEVYLLPADSTFIAPLEAKEGFAVVWNGSAWEYVEDHRQKRDRGGVPIDGTGTPYWLDGDTWRTAARYMKELGPLPEGAILSKPEKSEEEKAADTLNEAKYERADAVSKITIEVDGMLFDGDEISQDRMSRTISAAIALGVDMNTEKRTWILADNTIAEVTVAQLAEALRLAGDAQTALWTKPYMST